MNKKIPLLLACIVLFTLFLSYSIVTAAEEDFCQVEIPCEGENVTVQPINQTVAEEGKICIYFFYRVNCPQCARIEPLLTQLSEKYAEIEIKSFEVYFNEDNRKLFDDFIRRYKIELIGVPAVFIGDRAFIGERAIKQNLEESIIYFIKNEPICPETYNKVEATPSDISPYRIELTFPAIISAALIDSINPCAFAVLIFLLVYLMSLGAKNRILKVGLTYIGVVFAVYFFSGLGLFTIIQRAGVTRAIYTLAASIAIIAGLINVKDFFWYGKGITLAIPKSKLPLVYEYVHKATIPATIVLGVLVSMFELPCTGEIYLAILSLLSSKMTLAKGIPYLLLYNLIFVFPLLVILLVVYKGIPPEEVEKWRLEKRKWMRLAMGLAMIALGVIMLIGWI